MGACLGCAGGLINTMGVSHLKLELFIQNEKNLYRPAVEAGITWTTERRGIPGKLSFTVIDDLEIKMTEGNPVRVMADGKNLFFGFIFSQKRDKAGRIEVVAYDQLRYLKNKDTYVYQNKTASALIQMIAADFRLQTGGIATTKFIIPSRVEDNATLFDMIYYALDLELQNQKTMFILYDDAGRLTLKSIAQMKLDLLIDAETGENFDYSSSIDEQTYNRIKLSRENEESGKRDIYIAQDSKNIGNWGMLQYFDTLKDGENGKMKADALLSLYNSKTRKLKISKAFGDVRVRAGSLVAVRLDLGDLSINHYMLVEKVSHTLHESSHFMDLTLRGGEFIG